VEARRLLKEAGAESLSFQLLNRNVDQPLEYVATWLIDQWSKIGLHLTQRGARPPPGPRRVADSSFVPSSEESRANPDRDRASLGAGV
jgi:hypothetical protein